MMTAAPKPEGRLISVRKLAALDIALHGSKIILLEFGLGTPAIILFGSWLMLSGPFFILGLYLVLIGLNYVPLLLYAITIARKGSAKTEVEGLANDKHYIRKYGLQQLMILVPLAILIIALVQETTHSV
jgi:hypothetical protein